jgi:hypothetical protein
MAARATRAPGGGGAPGGARALPRRRPPAAAAAARRARPPRPRGAPADSASPPLPERAEDVAPWALEALERELLDGAGRPRAGLSLERACMLVALEEAAAAGGAAALGTASTWSLARLDALAAEARAEFSRLCADSGGSAGVGGGAEAASGAEAEAAAEAPAREPARLLAAVNAVLFERHGYGRQRRHGDAASASLPALLERGRGAPGILAIMYAGVAARAGLPLDLIPLEAGRYWVAAPHGAAAAAALSAGGERFVVDPYAGGALVSEAEVAELFGAPPPPLVPPPAPVALAALLGPLRDAHWAAALGCPPEPALMVPICAAVALGEYDEVSVAPAGGEGGARRRWWPARGAALARALAAARKRAWALPADAEAAAHVGLLLFFEGAHAVARAELARALELDAAAGGGGAGLGTREAERLRVLCAKARLMAGEQGDGGEPSRSV